MKKIPVVFSTDNNYLAPLCVAIASLKKAGGEYSITVLTEDLTQENADLVCSLQDENTSIQVRNIKALLDGVDSLYPYEWYTRAMYYRIMIPEIFREEKKVIYLDCDLVVEQPLAELYAADVSDAWIAGVSNPGNEGLRKWIVEGLGLSDPDSYVNSGVLVINCEAFREHRVQEKCLELLSRRRDFIMPDQDCLNTVCAGNIRLLDKKWNFRIEGTRPPSPAIIHFAANHKPWNRLMPHAYGRHFWKNTSLRYYKNNKKKFRELFAACPIFDCNLPRRLVKKLFIAGWRLFG